jgi:hypothetical protein
MSDTQPEAAATAVETPVPVEPAPAESEITEQDIRNEIKEQRDVINKLNKVRKEDRVQALGSKGVTAEQIEEWKKLHGPLESVTISGQMYVYRGLRRQEFKQLQEQTVNADQSLREEIVTEKCTLFPQLNRMNFPSGLAGSPSLISDRVMMLSGFEFEEETPVRL